MVVSAHNNDEHFWKIYLFVNFHPVKNWHGTIFSQKNIRFNCRSRFKTNYA